MLPPAKKDKKRKCCLQPHPSSLSLSESPSVSQPPPLQHQGERARGLERSDEPTSSRPPSSTRSAGRTGPFSLGSASRWLPTKLVKMLHCADAAAPAAAVASPLGWSASMFQKLLACALPIDSARSRHQSAAGCCPFVCRYIPPEKLLFLRPVSHRLHVSSLLCYALLRLLLPNLALSLELLAFACHGLGEHLTALASAHDPAIEPLELREFVALEGEICRDDGGVGKGALCIFS